MATKTMDPNQLKDICRGYVRDVVNKHDADACDRYFDQNLRDNTLAPDTKPGLEGAKQFYREMFKAFPDARLDIQDMVAEGDKVAISYTFTGTHKGDFLGIPASNKKVEVQGCEIDHVRNGKIVEVNGSVDMLTMLHQIGAVKVPSRLVPR